MEILKIIFGVCLFIAFFYLSISRLTGEGKLSKSNLVVVVTLLVVSLASASVYTYNLATNGSIINMKEEGVIKQGEHTYVPETPEETIEIDGQQYVLTNTKDDGSSAVDYGCKRYADGLFSVITEVGVLTLIAAVLFFATYQLYGSNCDLVLAIITLAFSFTCIGALVYDKATGNIKKLWTPETIIKDGYTYVLNTAETIEIDGKKYVLSDGVSD